MNHVTMIGATMIEGSGSMEDTKMTVEDAVEEHNGVYSGKCHIVSQEGFELPEGLEYLKNSWEGSWDNYCMGRKERIHKYEAGIKISNVPLRNAFEGLVRVLCEFRAYGTNLEIKNCIGNSKGIDNACLSKITHFANDFFIQGCQLTFKELASIMCGACIMSTSLERSYSYNLSGNIFIDRDPHQWERIKQFLEEIKSSKAPFKVFDLRECNFSTIERKSLIQKADFLNLLI